MENKKCLRCSKVLEVREGKKELNPKRKFCDKTCATRYNAKEYHYKNRDKDWYKKKQKEGFKKWIDKEGNREHFNDLVREPMRLYSRRKRKEAKEKRFCVKCFKKKAKENRVSCEECLIKRRKKK